MPEVYWVAPDFDLSELPETAEGFAYVEVDGVRLGPDAPAEPGASNTHETAPEPGTPEAHSDAPSAGVEDSERLPPSADPGVPPDPGAPSPN